MSKIITIEEVNKHRHKNSVWMIIHNDVYDVTDFLDEHPGGEDSLLDYAGKEATQGFEDVGHSEDARELMKKYKIGSLPADEHNREPVTTVVAPCCPLINPILVKEENKNWRDFDGSSPSRSRRSSKEHKVRIDAVPSSHTDVIVVPTDRSSNWKWYIMALLGAIAIGVLIKKKMQA